MANHRKTDLRGLAQPGAEFVQLQMRKVQVAKGTPVQGLSMLASTSESPRDRRLPAALRPVRPAQ